MPESYVPSVRELKKRAQPAHILVKAARSDVVPTPDHIFKEEELSPALRRLFFLSAAHADQLDNLVTETASINLALNSFGEDALFNARLLVSQLRDDSKVSLQQVAAETATKTPEAVTATLGSDIFALRSELSSYDESVGTMMQELDASCKTSLAALEIIAKDTSRGLDAVNKTVNDSNLIVASKFTEMAALIAAITTSPPAEPRGEEPPAPEARRFINPATGLWCDADTGRTTEGPQPTGGPQPEQFFMGSPARDQRPEMRTPRGYEQRGYEVPQFGYGSSQAPQRPPPGTINITPYSKVFEEKIASMKEKQYDGSKNGEVWRTDTMNYLIGRAPDIEGLLRWAESRNLQQDPPPISRTEVNLQVTPNGVDPSVLDGHLWGFLNLNLTGQAKEIFNNVPTMHGLEVWRRINGELFTLTDLRQLDYQTLVYAHTAAHSLQRVRTSIENWETNLRKYG